MKSKTLMQLVLERELLKEAEVVLQQEIFEQTIHDYTNTNTTNTTTTTTTVPYQYKLQYPHLLREPEKEQKVVVATDNTIKLKLVLSKSDPTVATTSSTNTNTTIDPTVKIRKPKKKKDGTIAPTSIIDNVLESLPEIDPSSSSSSLPIPEEKKEPIMMYESLPGPKYICRSLWPSFMSSLPTRDMITVQTTLSDYIDELDMRPDEVPIKFKSSARVGRGGRMVVDRIPIYGKPRDDWDPVHSSYSYAKQAHHHSYIYPTMISNDTTSSSSSIQEISTVASHQHSSSSSSTSRSASPFLEVSTTSLSKLPFYAYTTSRFLPTTNPPSYTSFASSLAAREREIYACSDSEDERVEIYDNKSKSKNADIKYAIRT